MNVNFYLINSAQTYRTKGREAYHQKLKSQGKPIPSEGKNNKNQTGAMIYMSVYFDKQRFMVSTGRKIDPDLWNAGKQRAKRVDDATARLNKMLGAMEEWAYAIWDKAMTERYTENKFVDVAYRKEDFRSHFNENFERVHNGERYDFFEVYEMWLTVKTKSGLRAGSVTNLRSLKKTIYEAWPELSFSDITLDFEMKFLNHFIDLGEAHGHVSNKRRHLVNFLEWATKKKYNTNLQFREWDQKLETLKPTDNVHMLELEEVAKLASLKNLDPKLEVVRDAFVFNCEFGLRIDDLRSLNKDRIVQENGRYMFVIRTQKKGQEVNPYLTKKAVIIWEKYKDRPGVKAFPLPSKNDYNDRLRGLARMARLTRIVDHVELHNWKRTIVQKPLHDVMGSHTARKTFCSSAYNENNYSIDEICLISGHGDQNSLQRYIKPSQNKMRQLADRADAAAKAREAEE